MQITEQRISELLEKLNFSTLIKEAKESTLKYPQEGIGWKALGLGLYKEKNFNSAVKALRKASMLLTADAAVFKALGIIAESKQQTKRAKAYFEYLIKLDPKDSDILNRVGLMYLEFNEFKKAVDCFSQLVNLNPTCFNSHINLAKAYKENNQSNKFRLTLIEAGKTPPKSEQEWAELANQWIDSDYSNEGQVILSKLINLNPNNKTIPYLKGILAAKKGNNEEAINLFKQSLALLPNKTKAAINLSLLLKDSDPSTAISILKESFKNNPNSFKLLQNLCMSLFLNGNYDELGSYINKLIEKKLDAITYNIIGHYNYIRHDYKESVSAFEKSLKLNPEQDNIISIYVNALIKNRNTNKAIATIKNNKSLQASLAPLLALAFYSKGDNKECIKVAKQVLKTKNSTSSDFSNYLFYLLHSDNINNKNLFKEHLNYGKKFEAVVKPFKSHPNLADPNKKLKIGFVSGDMYNHAVTYFAKPILKNLNKEAFNLSVFYSYTHQDSTTEEMKGLVDQWFDVSAMKDAELVALIRKEGIDILIDLSGHTGHNRLTAFAFKPAPIQMTAIGYPYTTGLSAMDYIFYSSLAEDIGERQQYYSEKFIVISGQQLKKRPDRRKEAPAPIAELPVYRNDYFTYASLNRFSKINAEALNAWVQILQQNPNSKLLMGNVEKDQVQEIAAFFLKNKILPNRLLLKPQLPLNEYMALFNQIDLMLDTWPYGGGTTNQDALSMGVPILFIKGTHPVQALSNSYFQSLNLAQFFTKSVTDYVNAAVAWPNKLTELQEFRTNMLQRSESSAVEEENPSYLNWNKALRLAWQRWCQGLPVESFTVD